MKKAAAFLTVIFLTASAAGWAGETAQIPFDGRKWHLDFEDNRNGELLQEYHLEGETIEKWTEYVSVQFVKDAQKNNTVHALAEKMQSDLSARCPAVEWRIVEETEKDLVYAWSAKECKGQEDQSEIARIFSGNEGIHVWHYVVKSAPMPEEKQAAGLKLLKDITVKAG